MDALRFFARSNEAVSGSAYALGTALVAVAAIASVNTVRDSVICVYDGIASTIVGSTHACGTLPVPPSNQAPTITTTSLSNAVPNEAYSYTLSATDPDIDETLTWSWASAASSTIPAGLSLDGTTGTISGIATEAGSYTIDFTVTDAAGAIDVATLLLTVDTPKEKLLADDGADGDNFGGSVAVNGNTAVVGANRDDDSGDISGSAYVFDLTTGTQTLKLTANDGATGDYFGNSVAVTSNYIVVGAPGDADSGAWSGSAYVFDKSTGTEVRKLTASDASPAAIFGLNLATSGNYAIIGAYGAASAYVFEISTGAQVWKLTADDGAADDNFGYNVAISGNYAVIGASLDDDHGTSSGSAYVFDLTTGAQIHKLTASDGNVDDLFGSAVAVAGNYAIIGAYGDDDMGASSGSAYVFDIQTGAQLFKLNAGDGASDDAFGGSVAASGTRAVIGAFYDSDKGSRSGSAYVFDLASGAQIQKLTAKDGAADDNLSYAIAIHGDTVLAGVYADDDLGADSGSAYVFNAATGEQVVWPSASP